MDELLNLETKIKTSPDDINPSELIKFLQNHNELAGKLSEFLFDYSQSLHYKVNRKKRLIIKEIIKSLPFICDAFLKHIFQPQYDKKINYQKTTHIIKLIKDTFIQETNLSYELLAKILKKVIQPPYTIFTIHFLKDDLLLRQYYEPLNPTVYKILDEEIIHFKSLIDNFKKVCYIPKVNHSDSSNPRVSKFGGSAPYHPSSGPKICKKCSQKLQTVFSFHISSLPSEMRELFPIDHEYVLVGYACIDCYDHFPIELFTDSEIDELVYDSVPDSYNIFNEARSIFEWEQKFDTPISKAESGFSIPNPEKYSQKELYFMNGIMAERRCTKLRTYLGGYPYFIQGDDRPAGHTLLLEMEESEESTNIWGDCGTCQVWMSTGDDFGSFVMQFASS